MIDEVVRRLVQDSLAAKPEDRAIIVTNPLAGEAADDEQRARREIADAFVRALTAAGVRTELMTVADAGAHNAPLPAVGEIRDKTVDPAAEIASRTIAVGVTTHSMTAPLAVLVRRPGASLRAISMPGVRRRSIGTALQADQRQIAARAAAIKPLIDSAIEAKVEFNTGDVMRFDLRGSVAAVDDGVCGRSGQIINAPFGEVYAVPRERDSLTAGEIPVWEKGEIVTFHVAGNRVVRVSGEGDAAARWSAFFSSDPARANVAEFGIGLNDRAVVIPGERYILEEEKVEGFHWAFGRSDHFGGSVSPADFLTPANCVHQDIVYNRHTPVGVQRLELVAADGSITTVLAHSRIVAI
jgi:hypothetical protein